MYGCAEHLNSPHFFLQQAIPVVYSVNYQTESGNGSQISLGRLTLFKIKLYGGMLNTVLLVQNAVYAIKNLP